MPTSCCIRFSFVVSIALVLIVGVSTEDVSDITIWPAYTGYLMNLGDFWASGALGLCAKTVEDSVHHTRARHLNDIVDGLGHSTDTKGLNVIDDVG